MKFERRNAIDGWTGGLRGEGGRWKLPCIGRKDLGLWARLRMLAVMSYLDIIRKRFLCLGPWGGRKLFHMNSIVSLTSKF